MGLQHYGMRTIDWLNECQCNQCGPIKDENIVFHRSRPYCTCGQLVKLTSAYSKFKVMTVTDKLLCITYKQYFSGILEAP